MANCAHPSRSFELTRATLDQKPILANLLELYSHDFAEFTPLELGPDGRFGYPHLDRYWTDPQRFPFLLYVSGNLAGFALVQRNSECPAEMPAWDLAEFFILRSICRRGIGTDVAHEVFARFPGLWQVRVMQSNLQACAFWRHAVHAFAGDAARLNLITAGGKQWTVFSFDSPTAQIMQTD